MEMLASTMDFEDTYHELVYSNQNNDSGLPPRVN